MKFEFVTSAVRPSMPENSRVVMVKESDLPVHCPDKSDSGWKLHPRVLIPIQQSEAGEALCPYCGKIYKLNQDF